MRILLMMVVDCWSWRGIRRDVEDNFHPSSLRCRCFHQCHNSSLQWYPRWNSHETVPLLQDVSKLLEEWVERQQHEGAGDEDWRRQIGLEGDERMMRIRCGVGSMRGVVG